MGNIALASPPVNTKTAILELVSGQPKVTIADGRSAILSDTRWSRWYLRTHFEKLDATKEAIDWYKVHDPLVLQKINGIKFTPRTYQILAINRALLGNCALWLDMGLGKTFITIYLCVKLFLENKSNYFLVLCPNSVFTTWQDEIQNITEPQLNCTIHLLHGRHRAKNIAKVKALAPTGPIFLLTSYETLGSILADLKDIQLGLITLDESSRAKNLEAQRTKNVFALKHQHINSRRLLLSGTPSTKGPAGFYAQYEFLEKGATDFGSYTAFEQHFTNQRLMLKFKLPNNRIMFVPDAEKENWLSKNLAPNSVKSYKEEGYHFAKESTPKTLQILTYFNQFTGTKNIEDLNKISQRWAYTLKKKDVLQELPEKIPVVRKLEMSSEQQTAYRQMVENNRIELAGKFSFRTDNSFAKLHQIANGFIKLENTVHFFKEQPKLDALEEILEEIGDEKLVIWSPLVPQLRQSYDFLLGKNYKCSLLYGETSSEKRREVIHFFQDPTGAQILIANPAVGGLGLNLTCAWYEIFMTNWYQPDIRIQAEDRLHRLNQKNAVTVIDLIMKNTLEPALLSNARREIEIENQIIRMDLLGETA